MNHDRLMQVVMQVVSEVVGQQDNAKSADVAAFCGGSVPDLSAIDFKTVLDTPNPANAEEFLRIKQKTSARLGVWRAGPRYRTNTALRFRADHAAAMDAVFQEVSDDTINALGLFYVSTKCETKDEYLTRPDLGRQFDDETCKLIKANCKNNPDVQIILSDGLSSTAVEANAKDILPAILQGLKSAGIDAGTPIFVRHGRVGAMDAITQILGAKVTVILLGERPGLATFESLSAYMTYGGYVGIPEANRTVVSNIYKGGTNPVEAGAHISEMIGQMLKQKASGIDLKL